VRSIGIGNLRMARRFVPLLVALLVGGAPGCGRGGRTDGSGSRPGAAAGKRAAGSLQLGDDAYTFRVVRCDPAGTDPDGMTLRGAGTTPDGRSIRIELERTPRASGGSRHSVFIMFGKMADQDAWEAVRRTDGGGHWLSGDMGDEAATGPLIEVSGRRVSVHAELGNSDHQRRKADLSVECPG